MIVTGFWLSKLVVILVHIKVLGTGQNRGEDTSRNLCWLKPIMWGEELHNNHHRLPSEANHNHKKTIFQFDVLYYIGKLIEEKRK